MEFARLVPKPDRDDAVILISRTARTFFALAAREVALASAADVASVTGRGAGVLVRWAELPSARPRHQGPFSQSHRQDEEACVIDGGSGRVMLGEESR